MNQQKLISLLEKYKKNKCYECDTVIDYSKKQDNLKRAIEVAALSRDVNGKKHDHQKLIPNDVLVAFKNNITNVNIEKFQRATNFDAIHLIVERCKITGIGELAIYDTAHRIGVYLNKLPDKIYLHRGTRVGAEKLLGKIKSKTILKENLPEPLKSSNLECWELEDFFCQYKEELEQ